MRVSFGLAFGLLATLTTSPVIAGPSDQLEPLFRVINFDKEQGAVSFSHDGAEITVQSDAVPNDPYVAEYRAVVHLPGFQTFILDLGEMREGSEIGVGIGRLSPTDTTPSVLFDSFSGGAHCCAELKVVTASAGRLKTIDLPGIDGGPDHIFPKDIDGDGVRDFERQDDAFRYQFASGAGSFSPPQIYNIYKGTLVDVSAELGFRPLWEKFSAQTKAQCAVSSDNDRNGACIAFLAAEARLGRFENSFPLAIAMAYNGADAEFPSSCSVALADSLCPSGQEVKFATFETAARWFLKENHYLD